MAQSGIVLETPRREKHTGAGADRAATALLLDVIADSSLPINARPPLR